MKKLSFVLVAFLSTFTLAIGANAQSSFASKKDKMILNVTQLDNRAKASANKTDISTRTLRNFYKDFKGITDDAWAKTDNGYVVKFTSNGIQNWAFLTNRGNCESHIRYYTEKELPFDVRHQVKSNYYDFFISSVKEVSCNKATAYLVTIEDKATWKIIRVVDGEMEVYEEYIK